jgi:hypothetical protein
MVLWVIGIVAVLGCAICFSRTKLFRAHLHGHGKDPGFGNTRMEGRFESTGRTYDYGDKVRNYDDE